MRSLAIVLLLALQESPEVGKAREVTLKDGESLTVRLAVAEPSRNLLTAVSFPEPVAQIVSGWNPKDLSVEHEGRRAFLKLLTRTEGHLDVLLVSGAHVRLLLVAATAGPPDSHVTIRLVGSMTETSKRPGSSSDALNQIRAMRLGEVPATATVRSGGKALLFESKAVEARLLHTYDTERFTGLVVELANRSESEAFHVDLTRLDVDRLVLAGVADVILKPSAATQLYLVLWNER